MPLPKNKRPKQVRGSKLGISGEYESRIRQEEEKKLAEFKEAQKINGKKPEELTYADLKKRATARAQELESVTRAKEITAKKIRNKIKNAVSLVSLSGVKGHNIDIATSEAVTRIIGLMESQKLGELTEVTVNNSVHGGFTAKFVTGDKIEFYPKVKKIGGIFGLFETTIVDWKHKLNKPPLK